MTEPATSSVRTRLRTAITHAVKQRDRSAAAVYRAALGAIDNAEAVPTGNARHAGPIELSSYGVGSAEAPRRVLTEQDMVAIVEGEARERCAAAELVGPDAAARLRDEADLLRALARTPEPARAEEA